MKIAIYLNSEKWLLVVNEYNIYGIITNNSGFISDTFQNYQFWGNKVEII